MAVEDHKLFPVWKQRLENLIAAKEAHRQGEATQTDVDDAQAEFDKISGEV